MRLYSPSVIADLQRRYDFRLSKKLGQNFITDRNIIERIIDGADISDKDLVVEIGPGIGVLTSRAAERAAHVTAIEIDEKLIPILGETLAEYDNVDIVNQDILKTDVNDMISQRRAAGDFDGKVKIIGNLPYYITTPIIMHLLEEGIEAESITIMMQKEVADRIRSAPGGKIYGALSLAVQYYCTVEEITKVPREVFVPRPQVDSSVLHLKLREGKPVQLEDEKLFFECIRSGFGKRRKTLLNSLTGTRGLTKEEIKAVLEATNIDPIRRAETLSMEEFAAIANEIYRGLHAGRVS